MKVCYFGTYRDEYSRNKTMIAALRSAGVEVKECHEPLWHGIGDRVNTVSGGWKKPSFFLRVIKVYLKLIWKLLFKIKSFDILIVGYPGVSDVLVAKPICLILRKKLIWDVLMSIYQVSLERNLIEEKQKENHFLKRFERYAANLANVLIMDTPEHIDFFSNLHQLPKQKFEAIRLGADETLFFPRKEVLPHNKFTVLYYGGFLKNHGIPFIIEAARLLAYQNIEFQMIGTGPELDIAKQLSNEHGLSNIHFLGYVEDEELVRRSISADICLGIFGKTIQAEVSVNNKIYECMAMGKAIITGDSLAVKDMAAEKTLWTCSRENPESLVEAIITLQNDPDLREKLGENARFYFSKNCSVHTLGNDFLEMLKRRELF